MMGASGFIIGVFFFFISIFLAQAVPVFLTAVPDETLDILKIALLFIGAGSIFIGARSKV